MNVIPLANRRHELLHLAARLILQAVEPDTHERDGLRDTPDRFARLWMEFVTYDHTRMGTVFEHTGTDQMVVVAGLRVWSMCEHHLLPFFADVSIGYVPVGKVLGLSKFARIAHASAAKLQLQERLVTEIADRVADVTGSPHVAVHASGEHLCMTMRGAKTPHRMHSTDLRGGFREHPATRAEFYTLAGVGR